MKLFKPHELQAMDERQIRQEYTRMRKEALRRLSILEREGVTNYLDYIPTISTARGQALDVVYGELREMNLLLKNPFTKISYIKKFEREMIETLHSHGYDNINSSNIRDFNRFMADFKGLIDSRVLGSDRVAEVFDESQRLNMDMSGDELKENFDYLKEHIDSIMEMQPQKNNKPMSFRELKRRITIYEKSGNIVGAGS